MSATIPLFSEIRLKAIRERRAITATVMLADDSVVVIRFGPRGGWKRIPQTAI